MLIKLDLPYDTVVSRFSTYPLPRGRGTMIACPLCKARIIVFRSVEDPGICTLEPCCDCDEEVIRDFIVIPDRKRLRRKYRRRQLQQTLDALFWKMEIGMAIGFAFACFLVSYWIKIKLDEVSQNPFQDITLLKMSVFTAKERDFAAQCANALLLVGGVFGVGAFLENRSAKRVLSQQKPICHVPPIIVKDLPAREILVRGSEEPAVGQSEVLLRAAKERETPKEELLRITDHAG